MACLVYDDSVKSKAYIKYDNINATKGYLTHYANKLYLSFILEKSTDRAEKQQASKELLICDRKLEYMKRHPNYDHKAVLLGVEKLKKDWNPSSTKV